MRFHIKSFGYHHYACSMPTMPVLCLYYRYAYNVCTMPIYKYRAVPTTPVLCLLCLL